MTVEISTPSLRQGGTHLQFLAQELATAWQGLQSDSAAMGDIFGDDDVGGLIGMSYQVAEQVAAESVGSVVRSLQGFGDGLTTMAEQFEAVEQDTSAQFRGPR